MEAKTGTSYWHMKTMEASGTKFKSGQKWKLLPWILSFFSLLLAATLCEWRGDAWEKKIRYGFYNAFLDSFPDFAPNFVDDRGIPVTYYPIQNGISAGYRYNGTIVAKYAIEYYQRLQQDPADSVRRRYFDNCVHWLDSAITEVNGHALYVFDWQQPWYVKVGKPFTCGMTSGRAIEVFTDAFELDGDSNHLKQAARLVRGYALPVEEGGYTYKNQEGWWYEEIADTGMQTPRILDGHIFALTGLHKYFLLTRDTLAKEYFDLGIMSLKAALPRYDRGDGFVYYDAIGKLADENYHPLLVSQMDELWKMTGDPVFQTYYLKWGKPLWRPYVVRAFINRNKSAALLIGILSILFFLLLYSGFRIIAQSKNNNHSDILISKKKHSVY